ncbi:MAG: glycine cleavage system aminomethyltransferase GcvT [Alphaproteobacteria bacterium]|nr:glycine cleavage system aminomethyltransferase GcvT [Alphaproteobacteria bacterium]
MTSNALVQSTVRRTSLYNWHVSQGAKMVEFAGYEMPIQYSGIMAEHIHTRQHAGIFDVSHMGQIVLRGSEAVAALEKHVPSDVQSLKPGQMRYSTLLNEWGGVIDDLIIVRPDTGYDLWVIVNASRKEHDLAIIRGKLPSNLIELVNRDLIALQGPHAADVIRQLADSDVVEKLGFMNSTWTKISGIPVLLMRSGYTGEDGFELSVEPHSTETLVNTLMQDSDVKPIGLGARDTLRLEAGLCLYGHELNEKTTPVEAGLKWVVNKARLSEGEFAGASILESELLNLPERSRVGIMVEDKAPAREGTEIHSMKGDKVGEVTSGGFSPTLQKPIAMGYVDKHLAVNGTKLQLIVRGKPLPARIVPLPFVPHRYVNKGKMS